MSQAMYLLFSFSMACLYVGEVVFLAYMGIKEGTSQGVLALILIFITLLWHLTVRGHNASPCPTGIIAYQTRYQHYLNYGSLSY